MYRKYPLLVPLFTLPFALLADVSVPALFTDHMVLQRNQPDPVWGKAEPGEAVTVEIAGQSHSTVADAEGDWELTLDPMPAGGPHSLVIKGKNMITIDDVLVGEVWVCSGQSNMQWSISQIMHADIEILSANNPMIRLITVPRVAADQPQYDFEGEWQIASPETVADFSAVGFLLGRRLQETLDVPIGLIDNAWGGSRAEAWLSRQSLEAAGDYELMLKSSDDRIASYAKNEQRILDKWNQAVADWEASGKEGRKPRKPLPPRPQQQPAKLYNGVLHPLIGYGIQGVIWYQGESNANKAAEYNELFPYLIAEWRKEWGQGDFPFFWVQLADFRAEASSPVPSTWAELREAQTQTMDRLPNTGEAVIIDTGWGNDIHPKDKQTVANRLVRWPLATVYGYDIAYQSPRYSEMKIDGNRVVISFESVNGEGLKAIDTNEVLGFAIAGEDQRFVWANAKIQGKNKVVVWSDEISNPVAVRYAWADNPKANLFDDKDLPVTPFRTDKWELSTSDSTNN